MNKLHINRRTIQPNLSYTKLVPRIVVDPLIRGIYAEFPILIYNSSCQQFMAIIMPVQTMNQSLCSCLRSCNKHLIVCPKWVTLKKPKLGILSSVLDRLSWGVWLLDFILSPKNTIGDQVFRYTYNMKWQLRTLEIHRSK